MKSKQKNNREKEMKHKAGSLKTSVKLMNLQLNESRKEERRHQLPI